MFRYTVQTIRSGQPRAYADTEHEGVITVECFDHQAQEFKPYIPNYGDAQHAEQWTRQWAKKLVRTLFHGFREAGDDDGIKEGTMDAAFAPTLKRLDINRADGTITALITELYND